MNKTKIEWTDFSWNPITGCKHGCWYCYARKLFTRFGKSFEPTFHPERLKEPWELKKPSKIFVCSVADLFAPWTPIEWETEVVKSILHCPVQHDFQLLTKNPENIGAFHGSVHVWVGATVTGEGDQQFIEIMKEKTATVRFVSFEPLLTHINITHTHKRLCETTKYHCLQGLEWVIVGRLTGARQPIDASRFRDWVHEIRKECQHHDIPIFMKNNLAPWIPKEDIIQEFPKVQGELKNARTLSKMWVNKDRNSRL